MRRYWPLRRNRRRKLARKATARTPLATQPLVGSISSANFARVADYIQTHTGIKMPKSKIHLIEGRLVRRVRDSQFASIDEYCDHVLSDEAGEDDLRDFINALTTNKTDFFREPGHFDYLRDTILPRLRAERRRVIRCWSAAASSGMEAYTLAMVLADGLDDARAILILPFWLGGVGPGAAGDARALCCQGGGPAPQGGAHHRAIAVQDQFWPVEPDGPAL